MDQRPRNKLVITLLALSVLAFLSVSIIPLVSGLLNPPPQTAQPNAPVNSSETQLLEEQEKGYQSVVDREPTNQTALRGLFETRTQLIRLGKRTPKDLIDPLEKLKAATPEQPDIAVLLAQTYQQVGDREAAAKTYREVLDSAPANINALQGLVALFMQENQASSAVQLLKNTLAANATREDFDRQNVELLLGEVYTAQQSYEQALELYDRLLAESPEDFRAMVGKALVFKAQGKTSDAQVWFDQATTLAPAQFKDQIAQLAQESPNPDGSTSAPDSP